jgi:hypothetical protein
MTRMIVAHVAAIAALFVSTPASAATYDYTEHYDYVGRHREL